ncbi:MAG: terpene cyclase/mutase family protein [Kiritimatiellae bacterium]|jgi:squalene-hopene/tetraprenyl-beta-curcumene cyclase|nr:terpene cyclase/mutase family protein [Kiritimatiellia bacterium]MDD4341048.1 terpene cyclase/mutase family protein [Kiritimatiellia bacterium]MDY0149758.1 terpene cyclase/mutase family protein [Kiritimatiellia bacterium]
MKKWWIGSLVLGMVLSAGAQLPQELELEARAALARGAEWLAAQQQPDGYWGLPDSPAMSALAMGALQKADAATYADAINRAMVYILTSVQEDGSIWRTPTMQRKGGGLANYNTAICMAALHALDRPELVPVIQNARTYLAQMQYLGSGSYRGGMGYDADQNREYADLSNSYMAYEAMRLTENVEDLRADGAARADLDWGAAQEFLAQIQNLPGVNTNTWRSDSDDDRGGFAYTPGGGASRTNDEGRVVLRSYGSMTYAGLLSLIYAEVDEQDERVQAAKDWAMRHWSLDENPGMGAEGLYYFFNVLTKSLTAAGDATLERPDGSTVVWREAVIRRLVDLQQPGGFWVNDNNRWWEADPNLVTAYTMQALATALD